MVKEGDYTCKEAENLSMHRNSMCKGPVVEMGASCWRNMRGVTGAGVQERGEQGQMTVVIQRLSLFPSEGSHWRELGKGMPSSGSLGRSLCWMLWMMVGMGAGVGARRSVGQMLVPPPWGQMVAALARHRSRPEAGREEGKSPPTSLV